MSLEEKNIDKPRTKPAEVRLEELMNCDKIIRPAYQSVAMDKEYVPMKDRIIVE